MQADGAVKYIDLLTYLIGHNNPINGFRPAATHPSRRFCSLRAYASWLHQSMTGLPQIRLKYPSCRSILLHTNYMAEPAQPLDINTLHNVHVVEELIQLTIESNAEIRTVLFPRVLSIRYCSND